MKFLVPNYSCLQNPLKRELLPPDPRSLCPLSSNEFVEHTPLPPNKIPEYATGAFRFLNERCFFLGGGGAGFWASPVCPSSRSNMLMKICMGHELCIWLSTLSSYRALTFWRLNYFFNFSTPCI